MGLLVALQHVGSSRTRDQTRISCLGRWILYHLLCHQENPGRFFSPLGNNLLSFFIHVIMNSILKDFFFYGWIVFPFSWFLQHIAVNPSHST